MFLICTPNELHARHGMHLLSNSRTYEGAGLREIVSHDASPASAREIARFEAFAKNNSFCKCSITPLQAGMQSYLDRSGQAADVEMQLTINGGFGYVYFENSILNLIAVLAEDQFDAWAASAIEAIRYPHLTLTFLATVVLPNDEGPAPHFEDLSRGHPLVVQSVSILLSAKRQARAI